VVAVMTMTTMTDLNLNCGSPQVKLQYYDEDGNHTKTAIG